MSKFDPYSMSSQKRDNLLQEFYLFLASLKSKQQTINFFKDLLTPSEAVMFARRIEIAKMLLRGFDYDVIRKKLRVGTATITRVQHWLKDGFGGYMKALEKVVEKNKSKKKAELMREADPNSFQGLAHRYPLYYSLAYEVYDMFKDFNKEKRGRKKAK